MRTASWSARVGAYLIDVVCACTLGTVAYLLVGGAASAADLDQAGGDEASWAVVAFFTAVVNYSPLLSARPGTASGQTLGRQLLGIRAVRADGSRLRYAPALARHLCHIVSVCVPPLGLVNHLWPLWDARKQTLHDKIARTLIVQATYTPTDAEPFQTAVSEAAPDAPVTGPAR